MAATNAYEDVILRRNSERWKADGSPKAWAQFRAAAVKGLRWFRTPQGGVAATTKSKGPRHTEGKQFVTGLIIDGFAAKNSYLDAEVLIVSNPSLCP